MDQLPAILSPVETSFAIKTYALDYLKEPIHRKLITNEIANLRRLKTCKNVVKLHAIYESKQGVQLVTNYAGDTDLLSYLTRK